MIFVKQIWSYYILLTSCSSFWFFIGLSSLGWHTNVFMLWHLPNPGVLLLRVRLYRMLTFPGVIFNHIFSPSPYWIFLEVFSLGECSSSKYLFPHIPPEWREDGGQRSNCLVFRLSLKTHLKAFFTVSHYLLWQVSPSQNYLLFSEKKSVSWHCCGSVTRVCMGMCVYVERHASPLVMGSGPKYVATLYVLLLCPQILSHFLFDFFVELISFFFSDNLYGHLVCNFLC